MSRFRSRYCSYVSTAFLATAVLTTSANAQDFYRRNHVPDIDQIRTGLPGEKSPGGMYCVPTSAYNLLVYLKRNGMYNIPVVLPEHVGFSGVTNQIFVLGVLMGTDPIDGTTGSPANNLIKSYVDNSGVLAMLSNYGYSSSDWGVNKFKEVVRSGGIARISYGRYLPVQVGSSTHWWRQGGHSMTLAGYDYRTHQKQLLIADPASDNGLEGQQSTFAYNTRTVWNETRKFGLSGHVKARARYTDWVGDEGQIALVDSLNVVSPISAAWFETSITTASLSTSRSKSWFGPNKYKGDGSVKIVMPFHFDMDSEPGPKTFRFKPREEMVDWTLDAGELGAYYVTKLGRVFRVDLFSGEHKLLHVLKGAKKLTVAGDDGDLFVLVDGPLMDTVVRLQRDSNRMSLQVLPGKASSMEFDPISNGPAFLSAAADSVWAFDGTLSLRSDRTFVTPRGDGRLIFKIDHHTGDYLFAREGDYSFTRAPSNSWLDRGMETTPTDGPVYSLMPTENSMVAVQDGFGRVTFFDKIGRVAKTQFDVVAVLGELKLTRPQNSSQLETTDEYWKNWFPDAGLLGNR
jgi:hypothetical protein